MDVVGRLVLIPRYQCYNYLFFVEIVLKHLMELPRERLGTVQGGRGVEMSGATKLVGSA